VGVLLAVLAWKGAPALEPPADPTASDYIPRPEWYFLGLFQLLKYFPGRLEVIGALVVPGIAVTILALFPWIDRGGSREWRNRRLVLGLFVAGLASVVTLTALGARDRGAASPGWNVREVAGMALIGTGDRCARCHSSTSSIAAPIEAGRIARTSDWLAAHVADPEVIAPGVREPPQTNQRDAVAIAAALARLRGGEAPAIDDATRQVAVLVNRSCLSCHLIGGVGGQEGPDLTHAGGKYDAASMAKRIANPRDVKTDAEMPAFRSKLTPEEIRAIADWLAARK
jgi:ubiquinol-cytochrome c reductase cytochrome b subunit